MKKPFSLLLACSLLLALPACNQEKEKETSTDTALQFQLAEPLTKETEYKADDGTVLLSEKYELPQLGLCDADATSVSLDSSAQAEICRTFNNAMQRVAEEFDASAQQALADAQEQYAATDEEFRSGWSAYAEELTIGDTYQTSGLLSVLGNGYAYSGGAHPSTYSRAWSFDLTTGEFITMDSLCGTENPLGQTLQTTLTYAIFDKIDKQGLGEEYLDGYEDYVENFPENTSFYFDEDGMTIIFDVYVLASYAQGPQMFHFDYDAFCYALSDHVQSLLDLTQEERIVADYHTAQVYWSWFHMSMPPMEENASEITMKDGITRYPVALGNIHTMVELRAMLCTRISEQLADEWLSDGQFAEENGKLYISWGERGSDITIGAMDYAVALDGAEGTLTQTVHRQDMDEATNKWVLTGEMEDYEYPFTLVNGHAVFSAFPCPL